MQTQKDDIADFADFVRVYNSLPIWKQKYLLYYCMFLVARHRALTFMQRPATMIAATIFVAAMAFLTFAR